MNGSTPPNPSGYGSAGGWSFPPTDVDEALQYTPLSSVVPFTPSMFSLPLPTPPSTSTSTTSDYDLAIRASLETLNHHAEQNPEGQMVRKYLAEVTRELEAPEATMFRFKGVGGGRRGGEKMGDKVQARVGEVLRQSKAGAFAEMVVKGARVGYAKGTGMATAPATAASRQPTTPAGNQRILQHTSARNHHHQQQLPPPSTPQFPAATPRTNFRNVAAGLPPTPQIRQNFQVQVPVLTPARSTMSSLPQVLIPAPTPSNVNGTLLQQPPPSQSREKTPPGSQVLNAVIIKDSPQIDRSQYIRVDSKSIEQRSRKRKRYDSDPDEPMSAGVDQRVRADGVLRSLQSLIDNIFQAEQSIEPDTSGRSPDPESMKYWIPGTTDSDQPCLSKNIQVKLGKAIKDVIVVKRFTQIPADDLTRLQKLCENTLKRAEAQSILPPIEDNETDMHEWRHRCNAVEDGLKASRTILQIMLGGREENQIYSEDILTSVLSLMKGLIEEAINPMIEMRPGGDQTDQFKAAFREKGPLTDVLKEMKNTLKLFAAMLASHEATEATLTPAIFMASSVVFVENASSEKDSIFDLRIVELFRKEAMEVLTRIFARYPDQRNSIFELILQNLEKLPVNRAMARQFKLVEGGKNIQLVSALIMQLIQTSGTYQPKKKKRRAEDADEEDEEMNPKTPEDIDDRAAAEANPDECIRQLQKVVDPLMEAARENAAAMMGFLVKRAMTSSKTGDQPYRHLLDLFAEDFLSVLGYPEWPAAELLLRTLLAHMCQIVDTDKQPVQAKTMALDMLGLMGSGICDLRTHLRESHRSREGGGSSLETSLADLTDRYFEAGSSGGGKSAFEGREVDLVDWQGPYRVTMEHLAELRTREPSFHSAAGYFHSFWSNRVCQIYEKFSEDENVDTFTVLAECASHLRRMAVDREWDDDVNLDDLSNSQIRQAYMLTVLNMSFCMNFDHLFHRLLRSMDDSQAQSRSKSMKSIMQLINKDATILDRSYVISAIKQRAIDASPLVRDSAVDLLGKCITIKPELEAVVARDIVVRSGDTGVAVRKRSMKILKDIYLQTTREQLKVLIAEALIQRIKDQDHVVAEQAKKTFEECWIAPFYTFVDKEEDEAGGNRNVEITPKMKKVANDRTSVIVKVVQKEKTEDALLEVIRTLLMEKDNKNAARNKRVCRIMLACLFDDLPDADKTARENIMQTLTVFAQADPTLFTVDQLTSLHVYVDNLKGYDDIQLYRSVMIIYVHGLAIMTERQQIFLNTVEQSLLKNLTRLPGAELSNTVACLNTISTILNDPARLIRATSSCVKNIIAARVIKTWDDAAVKRISRTILILGHLGQNCNFEASKTEVKKNLPTWKADTLVSEMLVDTVVPFCGKTADPKVRQAAIQAVGMICQTHASCFLKPHIENVIETVFAEGDPHLSTLVMSGMRGFLMNEERRSDAATEAAKLAKDKKKGPQKEQPRRLDQAAYQGQDEGVVTSLAQKYLQDIIRIATGSQDEYALVAVEVIASILRQGLVHPREVVPALVALETSPNHSISSLAYREHKTLHSKHETIVERGYIEGVKRCFLYQSHVIQDSSGSLRDPYIAKIRPLYEIVREGNRKFKKKFLQNLVAAVDFDLANFGKSKQDEIPVEVVPFAKFIAQNLAFLDYATTEDVFIVVTTMEKLVADTGMMLGHAIDTELHGIKLASINDTGSPTPASGPAKPISPERLQVLTSASAILLMLWAARNHLRKVYSVNEAKCREYRLGKLKLTDPLLNKTPTRNPAVSAVAVWELIEENSKVPHVAQRDTGEVKKEEEVKKEGVKSSEVDIEEAKEMCRRFQEVLAIDPELKVDEEDEEAEVEEDVVMGMSGSEDEKGSVKSVGGTPGKKLGGKKRKGSVERGMAGGESQGKRRKKAVGGGGGKGGRAGRRKSPGRRGGGDEERWE